MNVTAAGALGFAARLGAERFGLLVATGFFYLNDPDLQTISQTYGITYQHTLAQLINLDAGITTQPDVFKAG